MVLQHYYPWALGLKSFLKPSQLHREYTACAAKYVAQSRLIHHKNQLCPHRYPLPLGGEKQLQWSVLLRDISVTTGIRTESPLPPEPEFGALIRSATTPQCTCSQACALKRTLQLRLKLWHITGSSSLPVLVLRDWRMSTTTATICAWSMTWGSNENLF